MHLLLQAFSACAFTHARERARFSGSWCMCRRSSHMGRAEGCEVLVNAIFNGMLAGSVASTTWRKSSYSATEDTYVEVAELPGGDVAVRNSRDPEGPALVYTRAEMEAFAAGVKDGEFDWADDDDLSPRSGDAATGVESDDGEAGSASDPSGPVMHHRIVDDELQEVAGTVITGEAVLDRAASERLLRVLGAVVSLHRMHDVDDHGRCTICRPKARLRWWRRDTCSVHATLTTHLGHSFAASNRRDR